MKHYIVTLPIAGHIVVDVEAESEQAAIEAALNSDKLTLENIESWEALECFHQGNVCHCPSPWEAEVELAFGGDDSDVEAAE